MTRLFPILHLIAFLSCCIIAVALTDIHGHAKIGGFTIAFNESQQETLALAIPVTALMEVKK